MVSLRDNDKAKPLGLRTNRGAKPQKNKLHEDCNFVESLESSHKVGDFPINATAGRKPCPFGGLQRYVKKWKQTRNREEDREQGQDVRG